MKTSITVAIILIIVFITSRCSGPRPAIFSNDALPVQKFEIDISKDTIIQTAGGMVVSIKAGSLTSSNGNSVVLQIREALKLADMIKAGLTTTSNGELLSSGGMFLIEPEDKSVQITNGLQVFIPADFVEDAKMYKGNDAYDAKINWEDPVPIPVEEQMNKYAEGEAIFNANCTQCHSIGKGPVIGPALDHITKRRDFLWLEAFTLNSQDFLHGKDMPRDIIIADTSMSGEGEVSYNYYFYLLYSRCHFNEFNKTVMPAFNFSHGEIHQLYDYIENESNRLRLPMPEDKLFHCVDSCMKYNALKFELEAKRNALIADNGKLVNREETQPVSPAQLPDTTTIAPTIEKVVPVTVPAKYYQVNIKTFGWYNIDILLRDVDGVKNSNLIVRLRGTYQENISLFLVIPSHKVFAEGGKLTTGKDDYGFFEKNGDIPLPQRQTIYVFAAGESNGKFVFGNAEFIAAAEQTITIEPVEVTKAAFNDAIEKMSAEGMEVSLDKTKNAKKIRKIEKSLSDIEDLKPKNCDCNCASFGESDIWQSNRP